MNVKLVCLAISQITRRHVHLRYLAGFMTSIITSGIVTGGVGKLDYAS
jgi:hypothetical protein